MAYDPVPQSDRSPRTNKPPPGQQRPGGVGGAPTPTAPPPPTSNTTARHHQSSSANPLPAPPQFNPPEHQRPRYPLRPDLITNLGGDRHPSADHSSTNKSSSSDCFSSAEDDLPPPIQPRPSPPQQHQLRTDVHFGLHSSRHPPPHHQHQQHHPEQTSSSPSSSSSSSSTSSSPPAHFPLQPSSSAHSPLHSSQLNTAHLPESTHNSPTHLHPPHLRHSNAGRPPTTNAHKSRDSYADTYGAPASASGPNLSSLSAIASGLVGGDYGPFPQELTFGGISSGAFPSNQSGPHPHHNLNRLSTNNGTLSPDQASPTSTSTAYRKSSVSEHALRNLSKRNSNPQISNDLPDFGVFPLPSDNRRITSGGVVPQSQIGFTTLKSCRPLSQDGYSASYRDSMASYDDNGSGGCGLYYGSVGTGGTANGLNGLSTPGYAGGFSQTTEDLLWKEENREPDDFLHDPDPETDSRADKRWIIWSKRGWLNVFSLAILVGGLISLFALYPIITYVLHHAPTSMGWNLGGINGTGQVPDIPNLPRLIDATTPDDVKSRTGFDGEKYHLVFSDEFNTDGRTFWPGDDPFWEAVDLHYWQTTNFEWYDPDAVTTEDGNLVITLDQRDNIHNLNISSGMIQSWNKLCFTEGYIEVNISLPGSPGIQGLWPGVWTMGNLARAGFGASNEGMWPYSYEACDVGTLPNQTNPDGTTPPAAKTSGSRDYGGELSWLPGQRTSACTCPGEDHPGPSVDVGRSGPEIDVLEAQYSYGPTGVLGSMSQSIQIAPMDEGYNWLNDSSSMKIVQPTASTKDPSGTIINQWHGSIWQESLSGITITDGTSYEGKSYQTFGFEYVKGYQKDGGRVTWSYNGKETWSIYANALAGQSGTQVSPRPISTEPMYVILNLGISNKFQIIEWEKLKFPAKMYIDYVRIYQKEGKTNIGCSPKDRPTEAYINKHLGAYTNANFTTWAQAGYSVPKNRLKDTC